jgi:C-22 sterol desaturase
MAVNASFVSPTADAKVAHMITQLDSNSILSTIFNGLSIWRVLLTVLVAAVVYDQCKHKNAQCAGLS